VRSLEAAIVLYSGSRTDMQKKRRPATWEPDGTEGHVGKVGVLLQDGTVPGPVYVDIGSSGHVPSFTDWWVYTGEGRAPLTCANSAPET
jgi:hypothetical protein